MARNDPGLLKTHNPTPARLLAHALPPHLLQALPAETTTTMNPHQRASAMIHIIIIIAGMMIAGGGPQVVAAQQDFDASSYARNVSLDPNVDVFWTVDANLGTIKVAVHAKAATGWTGLGVSEMGGMMEGRTSFITRPG